MRSIAKVRFGGRAIGGGSAYTYSYMVKIKASYTGHTYTVHTTLRVAYKGH